MYNMTIEQYCTQLHPGQWFGFEGEKTLDNLILTDFGKEKGHTLPTQAEFEDWKAEQEAKAKEQEIIQKRMAEYGSPREQLERIIENGLDAEQQRVADIKAKYPKS